MLVRRKEGHLFLPGLHKLYGGRGHLFNVYKLQLASPFTRNCAEKEALSA